MLGRNSGRKRSISFLVLLVLLVTWNVQAYGAELPSQRQTVKAGFFAWDGYHVEDSDGLRSGYGYDFLKMTESYCNWSMEFVGYEKTWADMLDMLDAGEIDLLTSAQKTPEWEAKYAFSDQPIGNSATVLSVRKDETQYIVGKTSTYDGMRVGCLKGSSRNDKFKTFAEENQFHVQFVTYQNLKELKKALAEKKVDGILSTNLRTFDGETVLEEFDPTDYYVIVRKTDTDLLEQVNHAIDEMNFNTPSWKAELKNKYFTSTSEEEMVFDAGELEYLNGLKETGTVFTVVTNPDLAPYSSYDEDGKPVGIAPELFCQMADKIGLNYKFEPFDDYEAYNSFVRDGKADIDLTCFHDYGLGALHGVTLTNPYMTTSMAMVSQTSFDGTIGKIAVVEGSDRNTTYSDSLFGRGKVINYPSNKDVVKAVSEGKADVAYQYTYMAQKEVNNDVKNRLTYSVLPQYQIDLCMGTNEALDYRLVSVLNEGIRALSSTFAEHIVQENIQNMASAPTLLGLLYDYPMYAIMILLFLVLIVIFVAYSLTRRKQTEQKLARETEINNTRTEFFRMISHEIRTPLNAVVAYLRMLREDYELEEGADTYVKKAQTAANQLTEISDNMQDYAKISKGNIKLRSEVIKVKELILQVNQIISLKAKEKKQNYQFEISGLSRQYLRGDGLRLALIYQNILDNAVKFTPEGGRIEAKLEEELVNQEMVQLIFICEDSGKGMTEEFTKQINTAFHQSDASYSRTHGGLGLGLFLTQYFIKMMNGTFEVESEEGAGSRFTIRIPMESPRIEELRTSGITCREIRTIVYETDQQDAQIARDTLHTIGVKVDLMDDWEKLSRKIQSRAGGAYSYGAAIINVDRLDGNEEKIQELLSADPSIELIAITGEEEKVPEIQAWESIAHAVYKKRSYFELFNAIITDFGEEEEGEESASNCDCSRVQAMIVEDNSINADILSRILARNHIASTICENGKVAVDTFESSQDDQYQIIFMDIQMPKMDGLEASRRIRRSKKAQGREIPIVAVSANAFPEDVEKSLKAGMNEHLAKPVDMKKILHVIQTYCGD